jgi:hypothetical protein
MEASASSRDRKLGKSILAVPRSSKTTSPSQGSRLAALRGKSKPNHGSPPTAAVSGSVGEALYLGVAGQQSVDAVALDAPTASVNQTNFSKAFFDGGFQVALDHVRDLIR